MISLCMIAKDEEEYIGRALESVKGLVDEIIVVDTGSKDGTNKIAADYGARVYDFKWGDDFSAARNFCLEKATEEWILVLDADEIIDVEDHGRIRGLVESDNAVAYAFEQVSYTNDDNMFGFSYLKPGMMKIGRGFRGYINCNIVRLFRNGLDIKFDGAVHESVDESARAAGVVENSGIMLHHYQFAKGEKVHAEKQLKYLEIYERNLEMMENKAMGYRHIGIICYNFLHDYDRAILNFQKSLELNANNVKTYVGLAMCYIKKRDYDAALNVINDGLKMVPGDAELLKVSGVIRRMMVEGGQFNY